MAMIRALSGLTPALAGACRHARVRQGYTVYGAGGPTCMARAASGAPPAGRLPQGPRYCARRGGFWTKPGTGSSQLHVSVPGQVWPSCGTLPRAGPNIELDTTQARSSWEPVLGWPFSPASFPRVAAKAPAEIDIPEVGWLATAVYRNASPSSAGGGFSACVQEARAAIPDFQAADLPACWQELQSLKLLSPLWHLSLRHGTCSAVPGPAQSKPIARCLRRLQAGRPCCFGNRRKPWQNAAVVCILSGDCISTGPAMPRPAAGRGKKKCVAP